MYVLSLKSPEYVMCEWAGREVSTDEMIFSYGFQFWNSVKTS